MKITSSRKESNTDEGKILRRDFLRYVGTTGAILGLSALPFTKIFGDISNATNNNAQTNASSSSPPSVQSSNTPSSCHSSVHAFNLDSTTPQFSNSAGIHYCSI